MQIKIFITARLESSFDMHLMDEAQDIYTALQYRIGGICRSARGRNRVNCVIVLVSVPPAVILLTPSQPFNRQWFHA